MGCLIGHAFQVWANQKSTQLSPWIRKDVTLGSWGCSVDDPPARRACQPVRKGVTTICTSKDMKEERNVSSRKASRYQLRVLEREL